jgi:hypothetical protein
MGCFTWILLLAGAVFLMISVIRWFEQTTEAVDQGWWDKLVLLVVMPFSVWFFTSRVSAGRPSPVPRHEPVRGFGSVGGKKQEPPLATRAVSPAAAPVELPPPSDQPPPGTPAEFLVKPAVPAKKAVKSAVDAEKLEKLRRKMIQQGMLPKADGEAEQEKL